MRMHRRFLYSLFIPIVIGLVISGCRGSRSGTAPATLSSLAGLSGLVLSSGPLSPAFAGGTAEYTCQVLHPVASVTVTPTASDERAVITVNGDPVDSGTASGPIDLQFGPNTITILVTAEDGATTEAYTITVTRNAPSSDANLSGLVLSSRQLSPIFTENTIGYTCKLPRSVASITVTPTASDGHAVIRVNGTPVPSGQASASMALSMGSNSIEILVTAEDGATSKTYTVTAGRYNSLQTWVSGSSAKNQPGSYGEKGIASETNVPGAHYYSTQCQDSSGNFWLFGGFGGDSTGSFGHLNDLWKFDGTQWTWISGSNLAFQLGSYGVKGVPSGTNVPGARGETISWMDSSGNFWVFGGFVVGPAGYIGLFNDLWKFDGTQWTWVSGSNAATQWGSYGVKGIADPTNVPGARMEGVAWIDSHDNLWLFGGFGWDAVGGLGRLNDLWKFDGTQWTWVSGSNLVEPPGNYGIKGVAAESNIPGGRANGIAWVDSHDNPWLFGGSGCDSAGSVGSLNDLWNFDGTQWTWVSGSNLRNQAGVYGEQGVASETNVPGGCMGHVSWIDSHDNLWLSGGQGWDSTGDSGFLNSLWKFDGAQWTWVAGSNMSDQPGSYGVKGVASETNIPGARENAIGWTDSNDNIWLFGGLGPDSSGAFGYFNDLWKFEM